MGSKLSWIINNLVIKKCLKVYSVVSLSCGRFYWEDPKVSLGTHMYTHFTYREHLSKSGIQKQTGNRAYKETNSKNKAFAKKCLVCGLIFSCVYSSKITFIYRVKAHTTKIKLVNVFKNRNQYKLLSLYEKIVLPYERQV